MDTRDAGERTTKRVESEGFRNNQKQRYWHGSAKHVRCVCGVVLKAVDRMVWLNGAQDCASIDVNALRGWLSPRSVNHCFGLWTLCVEMGLCAAKNVKETGYNETHNEGPGMQHCLGTCHLSARKFTALIRPQLRAGGRRQGFQHFACFFLFVRRNLSE